MRRIIVVVVMLVTGLASFRAAAQKWSASTNVAEWANLATINAEGSVAAGRHATIGVGFRYNPWVFGGEEKNLQNKQRTIYVFSRWWPWNVYSGWWMGGQGRISEYSQGGIFSRKTEEGDAYGAGISAGYTLMVHKHFNLDFGVGIWGGYTKYTVYACPTCGKVMDSGAKWFLMPSDLIMSVAYIF